MDARRTTSGHAAPAVASVLGIKHRGAPCAEMNARYKDDGTFLLQVVPMKVVQDGSAQYVVECDVGVVDLTLNDIPGAGIVPADGIIQLTEDDAGTVHRSVEVTALLAAVRPLVTIRALLRGTDSVFPYVDSRKRALLMTTAKRKVREDNERPRKQSANSPCAECMFDGGCSAMVKQEDMRLHVAVHLARKLNLGEADAGVVAHNACGWCGQVGHCTVHITKNYAGSWVIDKDMSQGPYARKFQLKSGAKHCSNVPVRCPLCPNAGQRKGGTTVWRWSLAGHIQEFHQGVTDERPRWTLHQHLSHRRRCSACGGGGPSP